MFLEKEGSNRLSGKIALLALALLTTGALSGCSGDGPAEDQALEPGLTTGAAWQDVRDIDTLEIVLDESRDGADITIPLFAADDNEAFADFNDDLQDKADEWQAWLNEAAEGETARVVTHAMDTENYLSVVLTEQLVSAGETENEVSSYVYDKILGREMDEDLAMTLAGVDEDMIAAALAEYITANSGGANEKWSSFNVEAYAMDENEQAVLYIETTVATKDEDGKKEYRDEIYVLSGGEITGRLAM